MISGSFAERPSDAHVRLRSTLLDNQARLPEPAARTFPACHEADYLADQMLADIRRHGLAVVRLDRPLPEREFLRLGSRLGRPRKERDPAVQPYVAHEVILNLLAEHDAAVGAKLAPFSTGYLSLHSESSGEPVSEQPRYIVLLCHEPGDATQAQTVLVPMRRISGELSQSQRDILSHTRYRATAALPAILRNDGGRAVFSFRDFMASSLAWTSAADVAEEDVNAAIRSLLTAMYEPGAATGIRWQRGMLVVIDNTFYFHGRTAGSRAALDPARHLQRLRIHPAEIAA